MSRPASLRIALAVLLAAATALFAIGVSVERSDSHEEPAHVERAAATPEAAHDDDAADAGEHVEQEEVAHAEEGESGDERVLGIDPESTPLIVLAVVVGLALAGVVLTQPGNRRSVLGVIAIVALAWAALDVRELLHQLDESENAIAVIAAIVALLHLAAASVAVALSRRTAAVG